MNGLIIGAGIGPLFIGLGIFFCIFGFQKFEERPRPTMAVAMEPNPLPISNGYSSSETNEERLIRTEKAWRAADEAARNERTELKLKASAAFREYMTAKDAFESKWTP